MDLKILIMMNTRNVQRNRLVKSDAYVDVCIFQIFYFENI